MVGEEILIDIDNTLDQLIQNAEAIQMVDVLDLSSAEIDAFQKTQESLLQHLLHMDQFLESKRKNSFVQDKKSASLKIQEKLQKSENMKNSYHKKIVKAKAKTPIFSKRRSKRFLEIV